MRDVDPVAAQDEQAPGKPPEWQSVGELLAGSRLGLGAHTEDAG